MFENIISTFENDDIREFAKTVMKDFPDYFWHVAASSTGKYHPQYALGEGGLYRHTQALCRIINYVLGLECIQDIFNSRERDLMRLAGIIHDSRKSGSQEEYESNKYTKFDHPVLAANTLEKYKKDAQYISADEICLIQMAVCSHMGQWNTDKRSSMQLDKPKNKYQILVHVCDYLASRKDIEVLFSDEISKDSSFEKITKDNYTMPFGKYKGMLFNDLPKDYVEWMATQSFDNPIRSCIEEYLNG